ncbi:MAG: DUF4755 domain-containing protein [Acetobacter sp.]|uniref:DUF4755 domain-containing protein n=1 Tax=Acetobacter TaxID=434 RepID=UPI0039E82AB5
MIVIEKISDGINIKQATDKHILVTICIKMPIFASLIIAFFIHRSSEDYRGIPAHSYLYDLFYTLWFMYGFFFVSLPLFYFFRMFYIISYGGKRAHNRLLPLSESEYSRIKKYLAEKYQKPLIYFDMQPLNSNTVKHSWSKVIGYPNFIAFNGRDFFMTDNIGRMVKFNWDDVRQWSNGTQTGGMLYGGTQSDQISNAFANIQQRIENAEASGFFVTIKDVNQPKWQFTTTNEALQNKWMEIFRQVKDGTLKLQA